MTSDGNKLTFTFGDATYTTPESIWETDIMFLFETLQDDLILPELNKHNKGRTSGGKSEGYEL